MFKVQKCNAAEANIFHTRSLTFNQDNDNDYIDNDPDYYENNNNNNNLFQSSQRISIADGQR